MGVGGRMRSRRVAVVVALAALVAACSDSDTSGTADASGTTPPVPASIDDTTVVITSAPGDADTTPPSEASDAGSSGAAPSGEPLDCPTSAEAAPADGPSTVAERFDVDGVVVHLARYPRPEYEGDPWSHWGQGIVLPDGRFVSALGDHLGVDGNSFLYVYEPESARLTQFADVLSVVDHQAGSWGYGKVHAQMVQTSCDTVVIGTYWGTRRDLTFGGSYSGDHLLALDTSTLGVRSLGVPVERHGIPSLASHDGLVYGEAADPTRELGDDGGVFFVFDPESESVLYRSDDPAHRGFRSILVDADGGAFVAGDGSGLLRFTPGGELAGTDDEVPSGWLRAATAPTGDGGVFGVSRDPERFFAFSPDAGFEDLGQARGYTTSVSLHPDDGRILYVPGAHGDAWEWDASVFAFDPESGDDIALVALNDTAESALGLTLGGTYSVATDPARGRIFVEFNAGPSRDEPWGEVVLAVIELER